MLFLIVACCSTPLISSSKHWAVFRESRSESKSGLGNRLGQFLSRSEILLILNLNLLLLAGWAWGLLGRVGGGFGMRLVLE